VPVTSTTIQVSVYKNIVEVESIRAAWQALQNHPNIDIDFYQTILRLRPEILRPHILLACKQARPEALLVGRIEQQKLAFKLGYLKLGLLNSKIRTLIVPFGGAVGNMSEEICASLVIHELESLRRKDADIVIFSLIRPDSPLYKNIVMHVPRYLRYHHASDIHRALTLPDSAEIFYASLSSKTRKHLRQYTKRIGNDFSNDVRVTTYSKLSEFGVMLQDVEFISQKTWQRNLGVGFVINQEIESRLRLQAERGWLRAHILYLANKPCAFWIGTAYKGILYSDFLGYDPAYSNYAPGMFLMTRVIEGLCNDKRVDRLREIDFGLGDAQYKQQLASKCWEEVSLQVFSPSLRGITLNFLITSLDSLDRFLRIILNRLDLFDRAKTLWRRIGKQATGSVSRCT
jgi:hypothetical protein